MYTHNPRAPKYIKHILTDLKKEIDNNTKMVDFNSTLSIMNRSSRQKIKKETLDMNHILDHMEQIQNIPSNSNRIQYTFFSGVHKTLSRTYHMIGHKTILIKLKIEVTPSIFSTTMK